MDTILFLQTNVTELFGFFNDANKRVFWLYIASSIALAYGVYRYQIKSKEQSSFLAYLLPKKIYLSVSAKQDYSLFIINKFIKAILFPLAVFGAAPIAIGLSGGLASFLPEHMFAQASALTIGLSFTVILFIFDDFTRFFLHWSLHKIPFLWEFHKVHHSAKVLTPFTVYRSHPVENVLYACRMSLAQGMSIGVAYFLFGPSEHLDMMTILEANIFIFAFNVLGSNLRHSHIWLGFGNRVEKWLISPAQHQIHHSLNAQHFDTNFGTALAVWDRLFKCLVLSSSTDGVKVGLSESQAKHDSLIAIYCQPFVKCLDKLKIKGVVKKQP